MHFRSISCDIFHPGIQRLQKPPDTLFIAGELPAGKRLGIIGTRQPTSYGLQVVDYLLSGINTGVTIVSGGAYGIDIHAHIQAMKRGIPTCAILASGSNFLYPTKHIPIYKEIVDSGGMILTPYEANTHIAAYRFLERNVLLAAICDAIIVIEALEGSGTKTTAAAAASMNIPVGVVPGSIFSPTSHGTHQLLLEGATPIYSQEGLCEFLGVLQYFENRGIKESPLLERLRIHGPASFMELHKLFGKSSLLQELFSLEMQGIISQGPDFRYYRNIF